MYKVLVLAYYFPPKGLSGVQRTLKFVKYMSDFNWQPTVLTSGSNAYYAYDDSLLADIKDRPISIHRVEANDVNSLVRKGGTVKMPPEWLRKILSFCSTIFFLPDNKKAWANAAYKTASGLLANEHFDLVFVTGPPFSSFIAAKKLKQAFGIPVVVDYRDLWNGNHFVKMPTILHRIINKRFEYHVLKSADKIIVINRKIKEKMMNAFKFIPHGDIVIIPHGFDPEDFTLAGVEHKNHEKMILTYSGLFYENITPKYLLKAFKLLSKEQPEIASSIQLQFAGVLRKSLVRFIKKLQLQSSVQALGYLPHLDSIRKLKSSDVLWVMVGESKNADTVSTSKVFEYFGTGKPVIGFCREGALSSSLKEYGASYICDPYDIREIKQLLVRVYEDFKLKRLPRPDPDFISKFDRRSLTELLTKEFLFVLRVK